MLDKGTTCSPDFAPRHRSLAQFVCADSAMEFSSEGEDLLQKCALYLVWVTNHPVQSINTTIRLDVHVADFLKCVQNGLILTRRHIHGIATSGQLQYLLYPKLSQTSRTQVVDTCICQVALWTPIPPPVHRQMAAW